MHQENFPKPENAENMPLKEINPRKLLGNLRVLTLSPP